MSALLSDSTASAIVWIVIKASALLGVAAIVQAVLFRRPSAATRHLVWALALAGVLVLPALSLVLPAWPVIVRSAPAPANRTQPVDRIDPPSDLASRPAPVSVGVEPSPAAPVTPAPGRFSGLAGVYLAGVIVMLIHLMLQRWSVSRLAARATVVRDPEWMRMLADCADRMNVRRSVRLLRAPDQNVPLTFGTRRPSIAIPAIADSWSEDRRRAVFLHELAHVSRHDCLTQVVAFGACAMYWFHPAVWWVARRLRVERELACDDRVLAAGTEPRDYAGHLLEIAYSLGGHRAHALAVSMAHRHQIEGRMLAALDGARNRSVPSVRLRVGGAIAAAALLWPLAGAAPRAAGAVLPEAQAAPSPRHPAMPGPILKPTSEILRELADRLVRAVEAQAAKATPDSPPGTWEIHPTDAKGVVHLRLSEGQSSSGSNVPIDRLEGLTAEQLAGAGGPITFRLRRDAGTFTFEGVLRQGVGAGAFSFTPDPKFPDELVRRGFARPTAREQYQLTRHDIGYAFVDELNEQGYAKPETADLVRAGQHGVNVTYLSEMGALGYRLGSLGPLITLRDHGVTPAYARQLAEQGYKGLSAEDLRRARDHGITPEYVSGMRAAGYESLPMDTLINTRDHGVTPEYAGAMRDAGYGSLPIEELIKTRDHGVTPEFVKALADAGHRNVPLDQLIRARDHGVSPEYIRDMGQLGHAVSLDELVRSRDHGVSPEFVRGMAAAGYSGIPIDALIRARDHGVTPQYAQDVKALGYDRLPLEDLVALRDHGLTPKGIREANARAGTRLSVDRLKAVASGRAP